MKIQKLINRIIRVQFFEGPAMQEEVFYKVRNVKEKDSLITLSLSKIGQPKNEWWSDKEFKLNHQDFQNFLNGNIHKLYAWTFQNTLFSTEYVLLPQGNEKEYIEGIECNDLIGRKVMLEYSINDILKKKIPYHVTYQKRRNHIMHLRLECDERINCMDIDKEEWLVMANDEYLNNFVNNKKFALPIELFGKNEYKKQFILENESNNN